MSSHDLQLRPSLLQSASDCAVGSDVGVLHLFMITTDVVHGTKGVHSTDPSSGQPNIVFHIHYNGCAIRCASRHGSYKVPQSAASRAQDSHVSPPRTRGGEIA